MKKTLKNKRIKFNLHLVLFLFISLIFSFLPSLSQAQIAELSDSELKKLEKAEKLKTEAEELQLKSNELYLEASVLKQDEEFDISKKLQKEAENLEKDALKNEEKAAKLFEESISIQKEIYAESIEKFWKAFDGEQDDYINAKLIEETAEEYFFRAEETRRDASKMKDDKDAILKQNEAYELELMALEKLITAYETYKYGPSGVVTYPDEPPAEEVIAPETTTEDTYEMNEETAEPVVSSPEQQIEQTGEQIPPDQGDLSIDQQQLDMILDNIERSETSGDSTAQFYPRNLFTSFDTESLRNSMEQYQSMEMPESSIDEEQEAEVVTEFQEPLEETQKTEPVEAPIQQTEEIPAQEKSQLEIGKVEETVVPDPNSVIIYKVQLAADRAPIAQNVLKKLYYGDREVERINEEGWYKYSIGDFDTFEEADDYRKSLGVNDAFVVAYRGSKRLKDYQQDAAETKPEILEDTKIEATPKPTEKAVSSDQIEFVVQIAASKSSMDKNQLHRIYKGRKDINMRREEGWYKYQIGRTSDYSNAKQTLKNTNVKGAFIAAYKGDEKLDLGKVLSGKSTLNGQLIFVVQIAASKTPLTDKQIERLKKGNNEVREIREEGWHKYQIVAGSSYSDARRLKNLLNLNGAFAVAYKNGEKIDIRKAIKMTK